MARSAYLSRCGPSKCPPGPTGPGGATGPTGPSGLLGEAFQQLTTDASTSSGSFVDIFPAPLAITTTGGDLVIDTVLYASISDPAQLPFFQITIDGSPAPNGGAGPQLPSPLFAGLVSLYKRVAVGAGPHTINVQWRVAGGGATLSCSPSSTPQTYSASLSAVEV